MYMEKENLLFQPVFPVGSLAFHQQKSADKNQRIDPGLAGTGMEGVAVVSSGSAAEVALGLRFVLRITFYTLRYV